MQYISHYKSPLGNILLAADVGEDIGAAVNVGTGTDAAGLAATIATGTDATGLAATIATGTNAGAPALTGLWFEGQKYFGLRQPKAGDKSGQPSACNMHDGNNCDYQELELPIFEWTKHWLDIYFSGREPDFKVPLRFTGTDFQKQVWEILCTIPYGQTVTYGEIARMITDERLAGYTNQLTQYSKVHHNTNFPNADFPIKNRLARMSAQAVGSAVGHNKISIIVPCHRVIGANGSLTGYAGGLERKIALLQLENPDFAAI